MTIMNRIKTIQIISMLISEFLIAQELTVNTYYNESTKMVTVVNAITTSNDTIQSPHATYAYRKLWEGNNCDPPCGVEPTITVIPVANGYDIRYEFENETTNLSSIGRFYLSGFRFFDTLIYIRKFKPDGREDTISHGEQNGLFWHASGALKYPAKHNYSPVTVFGNDDYTVGISMKYPVTSYKHQVFMRLQSAGTGSFTQKRWELMIEANVGNNQTIYETGHIPPGETRVYEISVRFNYRNDQCNPWITTLEPYKKYFIEQYDQVTYDREGGSVFKFLTAMSQYLDQNNPYGFNPNNRVDTLGLGPTANAMIAKENYGYKRMMLWTPTGMYLNNRQNNYPFKFTSHWLEGDITKFPHSYGHKMEDALDSLAMVAQNNRQLGLWWGRAGQVMTDWDQDDAEILNPYNNLHVNKARVELDLALEARASLIGLDALTNKMLHWDAYTWLDTLRKYAPNVKFVIEQGSADFLHTKGAFYYGGDSDNYTPDLLHTPHYLANYLLPHNEIWAVNQKNITDEEFFEECNRLSNLGYVLVNGKNINQFYFAKETWYQTNPYPDLGTNIILEVGDTIILNASYYNHDTFTWYKMGLAGILGTDSVLSASTAGTYYVLAVNIYGCNFSDTVVIAMPPPSNKMLSVNNFSEEREKLSFNVYPNPGKKEITIENKTGNNIRSVTLMDAQGKELTYEKVPGPRSTHTMNTADYPSGLYLIQVETSDGTLTKKKIVLE